MTTLRICLSLGRVKRIEEGLGNFFSGLGRSLIAEASHVNSQLSVEWHVHARRHLHGCLGTDVVYHHASRLHRLVNPMATKFDIWHIMHQLNTCRPSYRSARVIATAHDLNFLHDPSLTGIDSRQRKVSRVLSSADAIVCISQHTKADVAAHVPAHPPLTVIYNGVDDLTQIEAHAIDALAGQPFFFHLSRMSPSKNAESLVTLASTWPEKVFVFAGPQSSDSERLRHSARALNNVRFLGQVSNAEKAWLYRHCEAFLFPSMAEGFGLPPLEAMQFGKPVFVSDRTSLPEVCGEAAFYWRDFDPHSMKEVVKAALLHPNRAIDTRFIAEHAKRFSWSQCARAYLTLYANTLDRAYEAPANPSQ
jgi:glycosyltransferase involved in cell wall biosynthesis